MTSTIHQHNSEGSPSPPGFTGRDMLCFSHDWTGDPLSKTHLMRVFARENRVLWVNSIGYRTPALNKADVTRAFRKLAALRHRLRQVEPNIFVLNPLAVPAYGSGAVRWFNRYILKSQILWAMRSLGFTRPINWICNPPAAVIAGKLGEHAVVYYCADEHSALSGVNGAHLDDLERQLMKRADAVIVTAEELLKTKTPYNPKTALVRHGVDFDHFCKALDFGTTIPDDIRELPRPVIGFFGLIADWVDLELVAATAKYFAHGTVVLLGKVTTDVSALSGLGNVRLLGRKPYEDLPGYCKGFDVALMPFRINRLTVNANPLKVREYLAAGLPVVSTAIPEVAALRTCRIASTHAEFISHVGAALLDPGPKRERSESVRDQSWSNRAAAIAAQLREFGVI